MDISDIIFDYINAKTPVDTFKCCGGLGCLDLEDFLQKEALDVQNQQIAYTVAGVYKDTVVGFITYGIDSLKHEYPDATKIGIDSHVAQNIPALRIYQLAVAKDYDKKGIGTQLITHVFQALDQIRNIAPCPQIIVTTYNDAVGFYERFGFQLASQPAQRWVAPQKSMYAAIPAEE